MRVVCQTGYENASIGPTTCQEIWTFYCLTLSHIELHSSLFEGKQEDEGGRIVSEVTIEDGIIRVKELVIQDGKAAKVLAEYPEARWAEITRRAVKIGLGYLKGGAEP
ncbi:MAG: hypothetical protein KC592_16765 [Nitrospira sp.]|nr:hypothetical protein [Nitrospira sp.]